MLYTYEECIEKYGNEYGVRKAVEAGEIVKKARGIYSDTGDEDELSVILKMYPDAVVTMDSAFYYHDLTDTIPVKYCIITDKDSTKIKNPRIVQYFDNCNSLKVGVENARYNGVEIRMFNRERMLIELIRYKNKIPFDYYKEIIRNYRELIYELDIQALQEYAEILPKTKLVMETIRREVL